MSRKSRKGGRPRKPDAQRRKPRRERDAMAQINATAPPTREALLRRLEAAGVRDPQSLDLNLPLPILLGMIAAVDAHQLASEFPLDVLRYQWRYDERRKIDEDRRRGITEEQWRAGWRLAALRFGLYGAPTPKLSAMVEKRRRQKRDFETREEIEDYQERREDYRVALVTLTSAGMYARCAVMSAAILWRMPPSMNGVSLDREIGQLRRGLDALVGHFYGGPGGQLVRVLDEMGDD